VCLVTSKKERGRKGKREKQREEKSGEREDVKILYLLNLSYPDAFSALGKKSQLKHKEVVDPQHLSFLWP
jgi:hypothetical protein